MHSPLTRPNLRVVADRPTLRAQLDRFNAAIMTDDRNLLVEVIDRSRHPAGPQIVRQQRFDAATARHFVADEPTHVDVRFTLDDSDPAAVMVRLQIPDTPGGLSAGRGPDLVAVQVVAGEASPARVPARLFGRIEMTGQFVAKRVVAGASERAALAAFRRATDDRRTVAAHLYHKHAKLGDVGEITHPSSARLEADVGPHRVALETQIPADGTKGGGAYVTLHLDPINRGLITPGLPVWPCELRSTAPSDLVFRDLAAAVFGHTTVDTWLSPYWDPRAPAPRERG